MTSAQIKTLLASYFRYQRQASLIMFERGEGLHLHGVPDVVVVTEARCVIEVEVKISYSDFKNDARKRKWRFAEEDCPRQFFYCAPTELAERIKMEVLPEIGVMAINENSPRSPVSIIKKAKPCREQIDYRTFWQLVRQQTGTLIKLAQENEELRKKLLETEKNR